MKKIFKYEIVDSKQITIELPMGAIVVDACIQQGNVKLWIEVPQDDRIKEKRTFKIFGTGVEIPTEAIHRSTLFDGVFVWHIYEVL